MYQVCIVHPVYGSRDEFVGNRAYPAPDLPAYQTLALAQRKAAALNQALFGSESDAVVRQWTNGYLTRLPEPKPAPIDWGNDIPF